VSDFLGALGIIPWTYRGWAYLFSEAYRCEIRSKWHQRGLVYKLVDVALSLFFMLLESALLLGVVVKYMKQG